MINILEKIIKGDLNEDEAYKIYEEVIEKHNRDESDVEPKDFLKLDNYEWTAFAHGASFTTIAMWRKNGWPTTCGKCNKKLDYKKFYWTIEDDKLVGIDCC